MPRLAIFVDGAYLDKVRTRHYGGCRIDYSKLADELSAGADLLRTYFYDAPPWQNDPPSDDEKARFSSRQSFFTALTRLPRFEVRLGRCARVWDKDRGDWRYMQKRVDVLFSVDLVRLASKAQISSAYLVGGDSDFVPAVEVAKNEGVSIKLLHSPDMKEVHRDLWNVADERAQIDAQLIQRIKR